MRWLRAQEQHCILQNSSLSHISDWLHRPSQFTILGHVSFSFRSLRDCKSRTRLGDPKLHGIANLKRMQSHLMNLAPGVALGDEMMADGSRIVLLHDDGL